mmetsp:Transcript_96316/g.272340  ORF Transcript_96316/g.272340 Transcript_96316/m.272340 type:complete len:211 (+) Transcript_96316:948-1580(+)
MKRAARSRSSRAASCFPRQRRAMPRSSQSRTEGRTSGGKVMPWSAFTSASVKKFLSTCREIMRSEASNRTSASGRRSESPNKAYAQQMSNWSCPKFESCSRSCAAPASRQRSKELSASTRNSKALPAAAMEPLESTSLPRACNATAVTSDCRAAGGTGTRRPVAASDNSKSPKPSAVSASAARRISETAQSSRPACGDASCSASTSMVPV